MEKEEPATVMVVDDEETVAKSYVFFIEDEYDAFLAIGGEAALEKLNDDVDVVLLDRRMPEMHGHEVLQHINEGNYDCRVIIISGMDPDMDIVDYDYDAYHVKPILKEKLLNEINQVLLLDRYETLLEDYHRTVNRYCCLKSELDPLTKDESEPFQQLSDNISETQDEIHEVIEEMNQATRSLLRRTQPDEL